jgi:hypothetical protein
VKRKQLGRGSSTNVTGIVPSAVGIAEKSQSGGTSKRMRLADMIHVPAGMEERADVGAQIGQGLKLKFLETLSPGDRMKTGSAPEDWNARQEYVSILNRFDDFLLTEVQKLGWRILLSDMALERLAAWTHTEPNGRALLERLGKELSLYAGIMRREEKFPLGPELCVFETAAKSELRSLLSLTKKNFAVRHREATYVEVISWMETQVEQKGDSFHELHNHHAEFFGFLKSLSASENVHARAVASRIRLGDMPAAELFNRWFAACTNRSPEAARQELSKLRKTTAKLASRL